MKKDPFVFIEHIFQSINDIENFSKNLEKNEFMKNKLKQNAIIRSLEVIGEAIKNIPDSFRENYPAIPWKDMAGMRDKLVHHYFGVDLGLVWKVLEEDIPFLKEEILKIRKDTKKSEEK